jgi:uncharacterized membrane protein (DUF373 family)
LSPFRWGFFVHKDCQTLRTLREVYCRGASHSADGGDSFATLQFASAILYGLGERVLHYLFRRKLAEVSLQIDVMHDVFAQFLLILIGIELMKTIMMYLDEHVIHVEVVLTVAIIAIARHAIDINYRDANPLAILATGVVVLALTLGYYFFKKAGTLS